MLFDENLNHLMAYFFVLIDKKLILGIIDYMNELDAKKMKKIDIKSNKKDNLSPYQKYLLSTDMRYNKDKQRYFDFYDDVKDKTHKKYDW